MIRYEDKTNLIKRWLDSSEQMFMHKQKTSLFLQQITAQLAHAGVA